MPGLLRPDAVCPLCQQNLVALEDMSSAEGVQRTYFHGRGTKDCRAFFLDHISARIERAMLEVKPENASVN